MIGFRTLNISALSLRQYANSLSDLLGLRVQGLGDSPVPSLPRIVVLIFFLDGEKSRFGTTRKSHCGMSDGKDKEYRALICLCGFCGCLRSFGGHLNSGDNSVPTLITNQDSEGCPQTCPCVADLDSEVH